MRSVVVALFFVTDTATTRIYTLSYTTLFRSVQGASGSSTISTTVVASGGTISLTVSGTPSGASAAVTPTSVTAGKDRKSTRLNSSHANISYAVFCLKKKNTTTD